jgi:hypothetical protein
MQTAALGSLLTAVLAASSAEAAGQAGYFVIAEVVAKRGSADELRSLLVPFAEKFSNRIGVAKFIPCLRFTRSPAAF